MIDSKSRNDPFAQVPWLEPRWQKQLRWWNRRQINRVAARKVEEGTGRKPLPPEHPQVMLLVANLALWWYLKPGRPGSPAASQLDGMDEEWWLLNMELWPPAMQWKLLGSGDDPTAEMLDAMTPEEGGEALIRTLAEGRRMELGLLPLRP